ncbi:MAG: radical SAM protein [Methylovulum sp.]|nr:radical SAM protein [Methylovulum sp.]
MGSKLSINNHRSDIIGLTYVYPVLSRRAGGLSIGINFNTNNTCNWRCIYCQVPNLTIGTAPELDIGLLAHELRSFLDDVLNGDFYDRFEVNQDKRIIKDIAIAGNGEPTSLKAFAEAIALIGQIATEAGVFPAGDYVLITNGSLIHQTRVQQGLKVLSGYGGQVWFKFDSATEAGRKLLNNTGQSCRAALENLNISSQLCTTKLQTCVLDYDQRGLPESEKQAYLDALKDIKRHSLVRRIMLYTIARPSLQPEAGLLQPLPLATLDAFADDIRQLGFDVSVSV